MRAASTSFHAIGKLQLPQAIFLAALFLLVICQLLAPARLCAQVAPAATGSAWNLWAGGECSSFLPGYGPSNRLTGPTAYADWNLSSRLGVEGEARFLRFGGFSNELEDDYLIGPRVVLLHRGKLRPYAKGLIGIGQSTFPFTIGTGRYLALAPGAGLDYRLSGRIMLRGDYEYQFWPTAPGVEGEPSNGLRPNGFSVGLAYRILGR